MSTHFRAFRLLTNLAFALPISLAAQSALADSVGSCPSGLTLYGEWAGGFCCNGTVDAAGTNCDGSICALDPNQTQGNPLCYQENSSTCRDMGSHHYYGGIVGGFCCDGSLSADKNNCNGNVCALDPNRSQGNPLCQPIQTTCPLGQTRYGEWAGGFCCDGAVDTAGENCNGNICALDSARSQGLPMCSAPSVSGVCPSGYSLYGQSVGGFCCHGTVDSNTSTCNGSVCALDPNQTQGNPLCYEENSAVCREMGSHHYYGGNFGGFCCDGELGAGKDTCNGNVCALDPNSTQGNPLCAPMPAACPLGQTRYGEWAGGFCCNGSVDANAENCSGTICALDPARSQGLVLCPSVMPKCTSWEERYGEWAGGFCCDGTVDHNTSSCNGSICALDPLRSQGLPLCGDSTTRSQGALNGVQFFSSSPSGGTSFRLLVANASMHYTTNGVEIDGDVSISGGVNQPDITLANAQIDVGFDGDGYISTLIGTAHVSLPSAGGLSVNDLGLVTLGLDWGSNLNDPNNAHHVEAPMKDDRQYVVFELAGGLSGGYGPVSFSAGNLDTVLVVDPRDPSIYVHGDISGIHGLPDIDGVGLGLSVQGLLPFEHKNTWGIAGIAEDFDGHIVIEGPIPLSNPLLSAAGQATIRLPSLTDSTTRIGINGTLSVGVDFVPNLVSFSVDLANATVSASYDSSNSGNAYFSGYAGTQGFIDALPDLSVMPSIGVHVAGRLSTVPSQNFLRVAGRGSFGGYDVLGLDMSYSPTGVWVSGNFQLGGGFRANLSGSVSGLSADLRGEAYVNIPIIGARQIVQGTWQTMNYVKNGAQCGWTTASNAAVCGWQDFTSWFCRMNPWLCTPQPRTCTYANSCTKSVWVEQTITQPNFNYGALTAKANFHVTSPQSISATFTNVVCPGSVGTCSMSAEDLQTTSPKVCVTSSLFGKFCQPMTIQLPANN